MILFIIIIIVLLFIFVKDSIFFKMRLNWILYELGKNNIFELCGFWGVLYFY